MRRIHWSTAGEYRCEVTADDYMTVDRSAKTDVVGKTTTTSTMATMANPLFVYIAVPRSGPTISGQKSRYAVGDRVHLNCSSNSSDPLADLTWYINGRTVSQN